MHHICGGNKTNSRRRPARRAAIITAAALVSASCTTVVDGAAVWAPGPPQPGEVDVALLDTGNYPTKPRAPLGTAGTPFDGSVIDAARMADDVVGPWEMDARLTHFVEPTVILKNAAAVSLVETQDVAAVAAKHNFINGFVSSRKSDASDMGVVNAVLRFADPPSAAAAAAEFGATALKPAADNPGPPPQPIPVPNHPETVAVTATNTPYGSDRPMTNVRAFTPHGPYVLMQYSSSVDGLNAAMPLMVKAIDMQLPAIDKFTPTDPAAFATLPRDPTGLLARTLPEKAEGYNIIQNQVYSQRGALHFQLNPINSGKLFTDTGMDLEAMVKTSVYQVRDAAAATRVVEQFFAESQTGGGKPAAGVSHLDASRCAQLSDQLGNAYSCFASADRYVIEAQAAQLLDAQQQAAAQYVMLTAK